MIINVPTKSVLSSATVWFNIATVLLVIMGAIADNATMLQIPAQWLAWIAVINGVVNTLLRVFKTSQPIGDGTVKTIEVDPPRVAG